MTAEPSARPRLQILVSGVGGQGVLFVARLLADAAIGKGLPVLTSETHGMAQRGGTVVSHLKVGEFDSPLIRAGCADGLVVLKEENLAAHRRFLRPGGWTVAAGSPPGFPEGADGPLHAVDAEGLAREAGNPQGANLLLLGFLLSRLVSPGGGGGFFCAADDLRDALARRFGGKGSLLASSLSAFELGIARGKR